jgi:transposase
MTARHRAIEFKRFLDHVDRQVPVGLDLHVICDNSSTHKTPAIQRWLVRHSRVHLHFTPTDSSWLNLVERWFAELTSKWLRRGSHRSVAELTESIQSWIDTWNDHPRPFVWTKPPTRSSTPSPATATNQQLRTLEEAERHGWRSSPGLRRRREAAGQPHGGGFRHPQVEQAAGRRRRWRCS